MLSKLTAKNQITIPKDILKKLPDVKYFDVELKDSAVLLKPVKVYDTYLDSIRAKMRKLYLLESSVPSEKAGY